MLMAMRKKAGVSLDMGDYGPVKSNLFIGENGLPFLKTHLEKLSKIMPDIPQQSYLLAHASDLTIEKGKGGYLVRLSGDTGQFTVTVQSKPFIPDPFTDLTCYPAICVFGFTSSSLNEFSLDTCDIASIQPIHVKTCMPVRSGIETKFLSVLLEEMEINKKLYLRKPLIPRIIEDHIILPQLVLTNRDTNKKVVFSIKSDDQEYVSKKDINLITTEYGEVIAFNGYEYYQNEHVFILKAQEVIRDSFNLLGID
jgi:hypothetical protein